MKYVPNSPWAARPKGMLSRRILTSLPACTIFVNALWAKSGLIESSSSTSVSFLRPTIRSCSSVGKAFQAAHESDEEFPHVVPYLGGWSLDPHQLDGAPRLGLRSPRAEGRRPRLGHHTGQHHRPCPLRSFGVLNFPSVLRESGWPVHSAFSFLA